MNINRLLAAALLFITSVSFAASNDTLIVQRYFTKQQLEADVAYLTGTINRVHPDMHHSISKQQYQSLVDSVRTLLHDSMSEREAWPVLARLVGALNEGHSAFDFPKNLYNQLKNGARVLFPLLFSEFNGQYLLVKADVSNENKLLPGDQVTAINGINTPAMIDRLSGYMGGLQSFRAIDVYSNMSICLYLCNISGPYLVEYLRAGKKGSALLTADTYPEYRAFRAARTPKWNTPSQQADYWFTGKDKDCAYLTINSLTEEPVLFKHFLDSCFTMLKNQPPNKLVIDLRKNGGGNSVLGEMLLGYITNKPFRMTGGEYWKVSQEYKDQLKQKLEGEDLHQMDWYLSAQNDSVIKIDPEIPKKPANNPLLYKGKVFVLIGPNTFSSANMLANVIEDYHLATLVGQPSGEPVNDYGELIFLQLPNTRFTFATSTKQFVRANGDTKNKNPVLPAYSITDNPLTPQDEVWELIKKQ